jgi:hypothetical protein
MMYILVANAVDITMLRAAIIIIITIDLCSLGLLGSSATKPLVHPSS